MKTAKKDLVNMKTRSQLILDGIDFRIKSLTDALEVLHRKEINNSATWDMETRIDELTTLRDWIKMDMIKPKKERV